MKPIALLIVGLLVGSAAGFAISNRNASLPNSFGMITNPEKAWKYVEVSEDAPIASVVDGSVYKFGRMELNSVGKHTFVVKNEGKSPLELTMEGTTCKCTMADLKEGDVLSVPPGESTEIKLEWRPKSYQDDFAQTARIGTNDPRQTILELRITGSVVRAIVIDPSEINFTNLSAGETRKASTKLLSQKETSFDITDMKITGEKSQFLSATQRPLTDDELAQSKDALTGYLIEVEIAPGLPLGNNQHDLVVKTTSKYGPELEIPIHSYVVGDISVIALKQFNRDKSLLYLGKLKRDEGVSSKLFLIVKGAHRDEVKATVKEVHPEFMKVTVEEKESINDGNVVKIPVSIEIPPGAPESNFLGPGKDKLGKIDLSIEGHPEIDEVNIGVYFSVD